jgi:hypothetical protein
MARPSSAPPASGAASSITVTPSAGRSPEAMSCAAWIVSGSPPIVSVATSKESDSAPTVIPRPSMPRGRRSARWAVTPWEVAAPTFVRGRSACETLATPLALASRRMSLTATKPSMARSERTAVVGSSPARTEASRTSANGSDRLA